MRSQDTRSWASGATPGDTQVNSTFADDGISLARAAVPVDPPMNSMLAGDSIRPAARVNGEQVILMPTDQDDLSGALEPMPPTDSRAASLIALTDVVKTYPGPLTVLKNVNVDIRAGEDVAIVGPSGSGKTTMLSIMGTLDRPTSGEVWIDGVDASRLSEARRAQLRAEVIGFVFQQFFLLPTLSAMENVAEGMLYQGIRHHERRERAMEALDRVGLSARAGHLPGQLSGGEQQRVAIARAIAGGPRLLFADEPTGALDQASGHMVVDYLVQIANEGTTVIVITHDQALAARFSRRISLLDGQIVDDSAGQVIHG